MKSLVIWRINFFDYFVTLKLQKQNPKEKEGDVRCTERVGDIKIIAEKEKNEKTIF